MTDEARGPVEQNWIAAALRPLFGRYRVFIDAWPIFTTLLVMSAAVGVQVHFLRFGLAASEVLTLEEFSIQAAFGVLAALFGLCVYAIIFLAIFLGSIGVLFLASRPPRREVGQALSAWPAVFGAVAAASGVFLLLNERALVPADANASPWWALAAVGIPLGLALALPVFRRAQIDAVASLFGAMAIIVAPGAAVFATLEQPPPTMSVLMPNGSYACGSQAAAVEVIWRGQKTIVLRCNGQIVFVEQPQNVLLRPVNAA